MTRQGIDVSAAFWHGFRLGLFQANALAGLGFGASLIWLGFPLGFMFLALGIAGLVGWGRFYNFRLTP